MKTIELTQLMAEYNHKLDEVIYLNKDTAMKNLQLKKSQKKTSFLLLYRIFEIIFYSFIVLFMGSFASCKIRIKTDTHSVLKRTGIPD